MLAWMASPHPGLTTTSVVSVAAATSTSCCPTPTVSSSTTGIPTADSTRTASGTATARPPRCPRVAIDRMNTPSSSAWLGMRTRSPRMAPPENGDDGSTARTATGWPPPEAAVGAGPCAGAEPGSEPTPRPRVRAMVMSRSVSVDLPAPGAPVIPTVYASPGDL